MKFTKSENYRSRKGCNRFHVVASVDRFCIDKANNTIYSMFRWYGDVAKFYIFLSDVSKGEV